MMIMDMRVDTKWAPLRLPCKSGRSPVQHDRRTLELLTNGADASQRSEETALIYSGTLARLRAKQRRANVTLGDIVLPIGRTQRY